MRSIRALMAVFRDAKRASEYASMKDNRVCEHNLLYNCYTAHRRVEGDHLIHDCIRYLIPSRPSGLREILGSNRVRGKWAAQTGVDGKYNHCAWGESALADQEEGRTLNLFATGSQMAIASILYRRCGGFRLELWGYNVIPLW